MSLLYHLLFKLSTDITESVLIVLCFVTLFIVAVEVQFVKRKVFLDTDSSLCYHERMGYSYAAKAGFVLDEIKVILRGSLETSNGIQRNGGFWECGREQYDGAITGMVYACVGDGFARRIGGFRIEPDGVITRFPTTTKWEREEATRLGLKKYNDVYVVQRNNYVW